MALLCMVPVQARVKARTKSLTSKKSEREQPLREQDILDAALALIRADGVDALGMRGLADKLGVSPMAIYYYVPNKEELLHRVAESLLASVPTPAPSPAVWEQQMRDYAMAVWELLSGCPGLSRVVLERPPLKASRRLGLHGLSLLRSAGFDEHTAMLGLLSFQTYLSGVLSAQARAYRPSRGAGTARRRRRLSPEDRRLAALFARLSAREWMEFGLDAMLAGIRARRPGRRAKATRRRGGVAARA
jgi:AcrR family transcriptional regulator